MWEGIEINKLKNFIEGKKEYEKVFPGFIDLIGKKVKMDIGNDYPGMQEWVGPYGREKTKQLHPKMEEPFYLDWVCFGFEGYEPEDAHVGVLFDLDGWPVTYRIGIHVLDYIWQPKDETIEKTRKKIDGNYSYVLQLDFEEHQLNDLPKELNFNNLDEELKMIASRVNHLYINFNYIIKKK